MTAEERETVFGILLSDGAFESTTLWHGEENGMVAIYNGADVAQTFRKEISASELCVLYGNPKAVLTDGSLQAEIPPESLVVFAPDDGTKRGVLIEGICYTAPQTGGVIRCESDAVAAHYKIYGGMRELIRLYINGDIVTDGDGEIQFFRWNKMQPQ